MPVILFEVNKNLKICFHYIIFPLVLAIRLWIKGSEKFAFDIKKIA